MLFQNTLLSGTAMSRDPHLPAEHAVIQYPQQQRMVFPLLALTYAIHCTGTECWRMYDECLADADNMNRLAEMHCTSSGLKALVAQLVCDGMETCRQACGGHAFLTTAGFQEVLTSYLPFKTLEGTREV
jgi:acyl-CoA oxidase